jgi:hypothetical protein
MVIAAGLIVLAGRWAQKKTFDGKVVIGTVFATVAIAALDQGLHEVAMGLAAIMLLTATFVYVPPILKGLKLA